MSNRVARMQRRAAKHGIKAWAGENAGGMRDQIIQKMAAQKRRRWVWVYVPLVAVTFASVFGGVIYLLNRVVH